MISNLVKLFTKHNSVLLMSLFVGLAGCSGGDSDPAPQTKPADPPIVEPTSQSVTGGAIKGPLVNAVVTVYAFDETQLGFKGVVIGTGTTDSNAVISDLELPLPLNPPYIMEITSVADTRDMTTNAFPVITTMRTVITQSLLDSGKQIYATPLTTMAVDIAVTNASNSNGTAGIQVDEFETALTTAASQVVSTLGFGLEGSVDIFATSPIINDATLTTEEQTETAAYRTAVEAITAIAYQISQQSAGATTDTVLTDLASDLADDGEIKGVANSTLDPITLKVLDQDPDKLIIPNTNKTVADVQAILASEATTTGSTTVTEQLTDGTIVTASDVAKTKPDLDNDGVLNADDDFPYNGGETVDTDGDGVGDNTDPDDDNNGILDEDEGVTPVPTATDTDGDGSDDGADNCPDNFNPAQTNTDGDLEGDACDADDDNDAADDVDDAFPLDDTESVDTDGDGLGDDLADDDDDNDGKLDVDEVGTSPIDGTSCAILIDCDSDGVLDGADANPVDATVKINFAPITTNDAITVNEDAVLFSIDVISNDTDNDGNPNDVVSLDSIGVNDTSLGIAVINGDSIDYTPIANAHGVDTFSYVATDGVLTSVGTVTITITSQNDAPVISQTGPLSVVMDEDGIPTAFVAPAIDATDVENDVLTWSLSSAAANGVATVTGSGASPVVTYTPNADFDSTDSFEVTVDDGKNGSDVITVDVTVNAVNDAPVVAQSVPLTVAENAINTASVGTVIATDVDSPVIGYNIIAGNTGLAFNISPAGQITVADTAAIDYETVTSFTLTITATDGVSTSTPVDVIVNIDDVNDTAPVVGAAGPFSIAEDAVNTTVVGAVTATDNDSVGIVTGYNITAGNTGNAFAISSTGQITVADTVAIDYETVTSFTLTITATDGLSTSTPVDVIVNIDDVNDTAPVVGASGPFSIAEDAVNTTVVGVVNATDADTVGAVTGYNITAGNTGNAFTISSTGQITVADTAAIDYETATSFILTITATDGLNTSAGISVTVDVNNVNDAAPIVGAAGPFSIAENAANASAVGTVLATDVDSGVTNYNIIAGNTSSAFSIDSLGQVAVADGAAIDYETSTSFTLTITATDGVSDSVGLDVIVNVDDTNDNAPVVAPGQSFNVINTATNGTAVGTVSATDIDTVGSISGYSITGSVFAISESGQITVIDEANLAAGSPYTLTVDASDGTFTSVSEAITITVASNAAPVMDQVGPISVVMDEDEFPVAFAAPFISATDAEGDNLTWSTTGAANGFAEVAGTGVSSPGLLSYIPNPDYNGDDSFVVNVSDGTTTVGITIIVTVNPVNDLPFAADDFDVTAEDTAFTTINVLGNDDAGGDGPGALTIVSVDGISAVGGAITDNGDGTFGYTPPPNFNGFDSFSYTVSDGLDAASGFVQIEVTSVNDAPTANNDSASTAVDTPVLITNVLTNDTDVEFDILSVVTGNPTAANGTVTNHNDGTFTYTPNPGYIGADSFDYTMTDSLLTSVATVNINVTPAGTPIPVTTLMSPTEGGAVGIDERGANEYQYWIDSWDSTTGLFTGEDKAYNHATGVFETKVFGNDLRLASGSWVTDGIIYGTDDGVGGMNISIRDPNDDTIEVATYHLSARAADISGELIADYLDPVWQGAMIDSNAVFNLGAKLITEYRFEAKSDSYYLWIGDWCQFDGTTRYTDLNGNCDAIDVDTVVNASGYAQILEEAIAASPWIDNSDYTDPPRAIHLAWNGSTTLMAQLVTGGAVNYYIVNWSDPDPVSRVSDAVAGTDWVRDFSSGVDMIQFQVPASFLAQYQDDLGEGLNYFLVEQNGFVRRGEKEVNGDVFTDSGMLNGNAMSDVLGNFSAPPMLDCTVNGEPYSYTDFETIIADCGPVPISAFDIENQSFTYASAPNEIITYNTGGTGTHSNDGGATSVPIFWSIDINGYIEITDDLILPSVREIIVAYGTDPGTGGMRFKSYSEGDNAYFSDLIFDGVADGSIWGDIVIPVSATSLSCGYGTPWDDINGQPMIFNSYTDFETVVADCGGILPVIDTDVIGVWTENWTDISGNWQEVVTFNADGSGSYVETLNGIQQSTEPFTWGLSGNVVTISNAFIIDVWANTASGIYVYTEQMNWGSDMFPDSGADGEIWIGSYVKQP